MADASLTDMVVFRENTEDIYAGIEWPTGSNEVHKLIHFLQTEQGHGHPLFREPSASASSPCRRRAASAWRAIQYAIENDRVSVSLVHKATS